jgi:hypothetical protein
MEALVGEQVGLTQKLVKLSPLVLSASIFGVLGFMPPPVNPLMASFPKSSAMINRTFGGVSSPDGVMMTLSSSLQPRKAEITNATKIICVFLMLNTY